MPTITKEDLARFGNRLSTGITAIGATIKENARKRSVQRALDKLDMSKPDNVYQTITNLISLDAPNLASAIGSYYKAGVESQNLAITRERERETNRIYFNLLKKEGVLSEKEEFNEKSDYTKIARFRPGDPEQFAIKTIDTGDKIIPMYWAQDEKGRWDWFVTDETTGKKKRASEIAYWPVSSKPPSYSYGGYQNVNVQGGVEGYDVTEGPAEWKGKSVWRDKLTGKWIDQSGAVLPPKVTKQFKVRKQKTSSIIEDLNNIPD